MKTAPLVIALLVTTPALATPAIDAAIAKAHAAVRHVLKDPASAQFRSDMPNRNGVCGVVNSKNSYGGYSGPKVYAYVFATGEVLILDGPASAAKAAMGARVDAFCGF